MKRSLLALLVLCVISSIGFAQTTNTSGDGLWLYTVNGSGEAKLVGIAPYGVAEFQRYENRVGFEVPLDVDGYPLTTIGLGAFEKLQGYYYDAISINAATRVENGAFDSVRVKSIGFGGEPLSLGDDAFRDSKVRYIYVAPNAVTTIGARAFYNAPFHGFRNLDGGYLGPIPPGVTSIGDNAFYRVAGLPVEVTIPSSVTHIGDWFSGTGVKRLIIPETVTHVQPNAFNRYGDSKPNVLLFKGSPPTEPFAFSGTIYRLPGASGWSNSFGGVPVQIFVPTTSSYSPGDLFLGFRWRWDDWDGIDSDDSLTVNIGPATQFLPANLGGTMSNNAPFKVQFGVLPGSSNPVFNLNADLASIWGGGWPGNRTDGIGVRWAVVGQTDDTLDNTPINGLKARSIFVTRARTNPAVPATPLVYSDAQQNAFAQLFVPFAYGTSGGAYYNTVNSSLAFVGVRGAVINWKARIGAEASFGLGATHRIEQGVSGNFTGPTDSVLDLFLAPRSGSSLATNTTYVGSFTLYKNGELIYWPAASNAPVPVVNVAYNPITNPAGTPFQYQISASNFPTAYGASNLPAGLSVNADTGLISGTPTAAGTNNIVLTAANHFGSGSNNLTLVFALPKIVSATNASGTVGAAFSYQIMASGNPTSFGATGLPSGLSINANTGLISGTPTTAGKSTVTISASNAGGTGSATLNLTVLPALPTVTWSNPAPIVYGTPLSATQLNAKSAVPGSFSYVPPIGTVVNTGTNTLRAVFRATDSSNYVSPVTNTVRLVVRKATPTVTWSNPAAITFGTPLSTTQLNAKSAVPGTFTFDPTNGTILNAGTNTLRAVFRATDSTNYVSPVTNTVRLVVRKAMPTVTWSNPAAITFGTPLSTTQLNAKSAVPGTFSYNPTSGTILNAGTNTLRSVFSATDTTNYVSPVTNTVRLVVRKAAPTVTWSNPAAIAFGTPLSTTQLNAKSTVPGTFSYNPTSGTILNAGTNTLRSVFSATDSTNYVSPVTNTAKLIVR